MRYLLVNIDDGVCSIVDGEHQITKNFKVKEFACKDGNEIIVLSFKAVAKLQVLRDYIQQALRARSAFRTFTHNLKCGGADDSRHMHGDGFDLETPVNIKIEDFLLAILTVFGEHIGLHVYIDYIHVDFRGYKARW